MKELPIIFSTPMVQAILEGRKSQTRRIVNPQPEAGNTVIGWRDIHPRGLWLHHSGGEIKCPYGQPGDRLYVRESHYLWGKWVKKGTTKTGREKWKFVEVNEFGHQVLYDDNPPAEFKISRDKKSPATRHWYRRLARFMPKDYARLLLEVQDVRVERLQEISEADAIAEGIEPLFTDEEIARHPELGMGDYRSWKNYLWHGDLMAKTNWVDAWPYQYSGYQFAAESYSSLWASLNGPESWDLNPWVWVITFKLL